jgi:hypothetical protein
MKFLYFVTIVLSENSTLSSNLRGKYNDNTSRKLFDLINFATNAQKLIPSELLDVLDGTMKLGHGFVEDVAGTVVDKLPVRDAAQFATDIVKNVATHISNNDNDDNSEDDSTDDVIEMKKVDTRTEEVLDENDISDENLDENDINDENLDENDISDENLDENDISDENLDETSDVTEKNLDENDISDVIEKKLDENLDPKRMLEDKIEDGLDKINEVLEEGNNGNVVKDKIKDVSGDNIKDDLENEIKDFSGYQFGDFDSVFEGMEDMLPHAGSFMEDFVGDFPDVMEKMGPLGNFLSELSINQALKDNLHRKHTEDENEDKNEITVSDK